MEKPTILLVDDEPVNLSALNAILSNDFNILACKSGEQAFQIVNHQTVPDIILLDVMMPDIDGYEVLKRLKSNPGTEEIPVIFITSLDEAIDEERGFRLGAVDYVTKPINASIVRARINSHLELKFARDRLRNQNKWLEEEVARRTRDNFIIQEISLAALAQLAETRDNDTGNHIIRTQSYVEVIAQDLQKHPEYKDELTDENLFRIVKASPLHDIGKVGIPDSILLKPGKLTEKEWEVMKSHATIGAETLQKAIDRTLASSKEIAFSASSETISFLKIAQIIALSHHEKWDGTGYPYGLKGQDIPLPGRMMAIADVFDAITTQRVYKKAWSVKEASNYIIEQKGKHFDPAIVDSFESLLPTIIDIRDNFPDK